MMTTPTLNMMDAYRLETLRSKGLETEKLIQALEEKDLESLLQTDDSFDYKDLLDQTDKKMDLFKKALTNNYAISYLTINGLKNLLRLKFNVTEEKDYTLSSQRLDDLIVTSDQLKTIETLIGSVWRVEVTDEPRPSRSKISIIHSSN